MQFNPDESRQIEQTIDQIIDVTMYEFGVHDVDRETYANVRTELRHRIEDHHASLADADPDETTYTSRGDDSDDDSDDDTDGFDLDDSDDVCDISDSDDSDVHGLNTDTTPFDTPLDHPFGSVTTPGSLLSGSSLLPFNLPTHEPSHNRLTLGGPPSRRRRSSDMKQAREFIKRYGSAMYGNGDDEIAVEFDNSEAVIDATKLDNGEAGALFQAIANNDRHSMLDLCRKASTDEEDDE